MAAPTTPTTGQTMTAELWPYLAGITILISWLLWIVLAPVLKEEPVTEYHCARCQTLTTVLYRIWDDTGPVMVCRDCWRTR